MNISYHPTQNDRPTLTEMTGVASLTSEAFPPASDWPAAITSRSKKQFIRGPLSLDWLQTACRAGGTEVALYLVYKWGVLGTKVKIQIRPRDLRRFGLADRRRRAQLVALEQAGLIRIIPRKGACPIVEAVLSPFL